MVDPEQSPHHDERAARELYEQLTGSRAQPTWLAQCRHAFSDNTTRDLLDTTTPEAHALTCYSRQWRTNPLQDEAETPDQSESARTPFDYSAASAVAHLTCAIAGTRDPAQGAKTFLDHFAASGLCSVGTPFAAGPRPHGPATLVRVFAQLWRDAPAQLRGFAILTALEVAGVRPAERRTTEIPVLLVASNRDSNGNETGEVGRLTLHLLESGPSGMHPDPAWSGFAQPDPEFMRSLHTAWNSSTLTDTDSCVIWSVTGEHGGPYARLRGASMTVAIAIALNDLAPRHPRLRALRPHTLDPKTTATADLNTDGTLAHVTGYASKLPAANSKGVRIIVPLDDHDEAKDSVPQGFCPELVPARTLADAIAEARTRPNPTRRAVALAITMVAVLAGAWIWVLDANHRTELEMTRSRQLADTARTLREVDPAIAQQLALAALRIADTPQARTELLSSSAGDVPYRITGAGTVLTTTPNGDRLVAATPDGRVTFATITASGIDELARFPIGFEVAGISLSPDSQRLTAWREIDRKQCTPFGNDAVSCDAVPGTARVQVWDTNGRPHPIYDLPVGDDEVVSTATAANSREIAVGMRNGKILRWDISSDTAPAPLPTLELPSGYPIVAYSPAGTLLGAAGTVSPGQTNQVRIWDTTRVRSDGAVPDFDRPPTSIAVMTNQYPCRPCAERRLHGDCSRLMPTGASVARGATHHGFTGLADARGAVGATKGTGHHSRSGSRRVRCRRGQRTRCGHRGGEFRRRNLRDSRRSRGCERLYRNRSSRCRGNRDQCGFRTGCRRRCGFRNRGGRCRTGLGVRLRARLDRILFRRNDSDHDEPQKRRRQDPSCRLAVADARPTQATTHQAYDGDYDQSHPHENEDGYHCLHELCSPAVDAATHPLPGGALGFRRRVLFVEFAPATITGSAGTTAYPSDCAPRYTKADGESACSDRWGQSPFRLCHHGSVGRGGLG
ncbi:WD40 repeat domain-containing protein [Nocardia brasiliensis]|uniref:WD40 repeat domain-containing protein n=1 Tax=Nocardia brasiliensis TaxID=37326 RepID=UPI00189565D9|nr:WD40 repeat domain-containing protein [Nocardia brasiliensis]MBF6129668.1 WD40 repeat domain-containing protein [Nocardia brasiliensis]